MRRGFWLNLLLVLVGIVTGSMVMEITAGLPWLGWLSYGLDFGTDVPLSLDLHVLKLTLGATIHISVAHVVFVALAVVLGRLIARD